MAGQITLTLSRGIGGTGTPLSAQYPQVGSVTQFLNTNVAASSSVFALGLSWFAPGAASGDLVSCYLLASQPCTLQTNGVGTIGVQTLTMTGTPTGGTFVLGYKGAITSNLAYNISAATLQTALNALSTIGASGVICTGGPFPGTAITVSFASALQVATVPLFTYNIAGLTGGSPALAVANASGTPQDVIQLGAMIPLDWDISAGTTCPFLGSVTNVYVTNTNALNFKAGVLTY